MLATNSHRLLRKEDNNDDDNDDNSLANPTCNGPSGHTLLEYLIPMRLLTPGTVLAAFLRSCCFAAVPTRISLSVKATTEGVMRSPESFATT